MKLKVTITVTIDSRLGHPMAFLKLLKAWLAGLKYDTRGAYVATIDCPLLKNNNK